MEARHPGISGQSILSFEGHLDFTLARGQLAIIETHDGERASSIVDLCVGLADPPAGVVRFLGRDWRELSFRERLEMRARIGAVVQSHIWPAHLSVAEAVLAPRLYHTRQPEGVLVAEAASLARLFGLPGLPAGRRDTTPDNELIRAACVRGFVGAPDFVVVQDPAIESATSLAVAMAQAIGAVQDRGGAVLWVATASSAAATRYLQADQVLRLRDNGLAPVRRGS